MNSIFIHDLRVRTRIGVYAWERHLPQMLRLDVDLGLPNDAPFRSDDIADALDYAAVVKRLQQFAADQRYHLLERFAQGVADIALQEFAASWVKVRVAKLGAVPGVRELGVMIERQRS